MGILLISNDCRISVWKQLRESFSRLRRYSSFWEKVDFYLDEPLYNIDPFLTEGQKIAVIHFGLLNLVRYYHEADDDWGIIEQSKDDLVFEGTNKTIHSLVQSFTHYSPNEDQENNEYYLKRQPPVFIFVFVDVITPTITNILDASIGTYESGYYKREVYVIAIPLAEQHKKVTQNTMEKVLTKLWGLLNQQTVVNDFLSAFPDSKHFVQKEQFESNGDDDSTQYDLRKALDVKIGPESKNKAHSTIGDKSAETNLDEANCTVYAPIHVKQNSEFLVQVFAHTEEQISLLSELAKDTDESSSHRATTILTKELKRGKKIDFQLTIDGLIIEESFLSIVWMGKISSVQFAVKVPYETPISDKICKLLVLDRTVPIGQLKFKISILSSNGKLPGTDKSTVTMRRFQKAFISYASKDRKEVLKRVQMLNLVKLNFFQDLLTLEPGEQWEKQIYSYIDDCDVFFLFWSTAATASEWVRKELLYALKLKKDDNEAPPEIIPVIIEGPPSPKPPTELNYLHFNDKFLYFIN